MSVFHSRGFPAPSGSRCRSSPGPAERSGIRWRGCPLPWTCRFPFLSASVLALRAPSFVCSAENATLTTLLQSQSFVTTSLLSNCAAERQKVRSSIDGRDRSKPERLHECGLRATANAPKKGAALRAARIHRGETSHLPGAGLDPE